jgi:hypothetical protein
MDILSNKFQNIIVSQKKLNKKDIVSKFVEVPLKSRREFWQREYVLLNRLIERYSIEFLKDTTFTFKGESLAILFADKILKDLDSRFRIYKSDLQSKPEIIVLKDDPNVEKRHIARKPKTIKDFLNGQD